MPLILLSKKTRNEHIFGYFLLLLLCCLSNIISQSITQIGRKKATRVKKTQNTRRKQKIKRVDKK